MIAAVTHIPSEHFVYQHVSCPDTEPHHTRQQAYHGMRSRLGSPFQVLQARLLNLPDLIAYQLPALHIGLECCNRAGRDRLALWCAEGL